MVNKQPNKSECCNSDIACDNITTRCICIKCGADANSVTIRVNKEEWLNLQVYKLQLLADKGVPIDWIAKAF